MERLLLQRGVYALPGKVGFILKLLAASAALGGAALVAVHSVGEKSDPSPAEERLSSLATSKFQPADENRFYLPVAGRRYVYSFDRKITFEGQLAGQALPSLGYHGDFYVDVLRADARAFEALVYQRVKEAGNQLSPPVRVEVDARGDSLAFFTGEKLSEDENQHVAVVKDLVSLWLFPLRSDTVGPYDAKFESRAGDERKAKLAYLGKGPNLPEVLRSLHVLRWNTAIHLPGEVRGQEQTRLGAATGQPLTATSAYGIRFVSYEPLKAVPRELLSSLRRESALAAASKPSMDKHPDYAKLSWDEVLTRVRALDRLEGGEQLEAFGDLVKLLRMHPDKTSELAAMLRDPLLLKAGAQSALFRTLVGALATAGSPEALAALREAYSDPALGDNSRATILAALTTTQAPLDSPTRDFLAARMLAEKDGHLAQAAAFALGSSLQNSPADASSARGIAQIESAWGALSQSPSADLGPRLTLLDVMGNSGRPEFYTQVSGVIASGADVKLRARAVFALRFMQNSAATSDLLTRLSDPAPELREAAARALEHAEWKESYRAPLGVCAAGESVERVRASCQGTLANHPAVAGN